MGFIFLDVMAKVGNNIPVFLCPKSLHSKMVV